MVAQLKISAGVPGPPSWNFSCFFNGSKIQVCLGTFYKNVSVKNKETILCTNHLG